jgi:hypothetical protein
MVPFEPDIGKIGELFITGYFIRRKMAMVVNDREIFGILVVQSLRCFSLQEKIISKHIILHKLIYG